MRSETIYRGLCRPFVLTLVLLLAVCSFVGPSLRAGRTTENDELVQCAKTVSSDMNAADFVGVGQPLAYYQAIFSHPDTNLGKVCACFAPGTDEHVVAFVNEQIQIGPDGERYQIGSRWPGTGGTPQSLTWSFVPDGLSISGGVGEPTANSELFSRMDSLFAAQGGRATWIQRVQQSFDRWSQLCAVTYTRITFGGNDWDDGAAWGTAGAAGARGDIRISMHPIDGTNNILAYTFFPSSGDMVFDRAENWASSTNVNRFFRNTFMHEHGHGLGLSHVCPSNGTKLMEPFLNTGFDGLRHDDVRAGQNNYGDINENNDSVATATPIGTLAPGSPINLGALPPPVSGTSPSNSSTLCIEYVGKTDFFQFHVNNSILATITVTPQGLTYLNGPQNGDGTCSAGTNFNSLAVANLAIQVIGIDGTTVLATADANGAGSAETITNVWLGAAGDYYLKVYASNVPLESQLYSLAFSATAFCPGVSVDPPTLPNAVVGQFYNQALSASGGTGPYTFSLVFGALPPELTLSGAGVISGTPINSSGVFNITVQATDAGNCTGVRAYPFTVVCALPGDINNDSTVDALDIQGFSDCLVSGNSPGDYCGCADMDGNGSLSATFDTPLFVGALVP